MKKVLNNPLFMFILGALIFGSIGVIAGVINANDIQYDSTHTVKDKIDDLYTKQIEKIEGETDFDAFVVDNSHFYIQLSSIDKKYNYFSISLTAKGDTASCSTYSTNIGTKISDLTLNTDYSTKSDGISNYRIYFGATNGWCRFNITYHN